MALEARTEMLHQFADSSPAAKLGVRQLRALTFLFFYALPDEAGHNANWDALGYPGLISAPPSPEQAPKTIALEHARVSRRRFRPTSAWSAPVPAAV